jgi:ATPase subunit of ABC transporter with duplicated ATPase domains
MGQTAVRIKALTHGYQDKRLFDNANLEIERGERVALIGPNGAGKSTLLRLVMGREQPISGTVELGAHGIVPNYFEQNQAEALDPQLSAIETLERAAPDAEMQDIKALLGRMLFSGRAGHKKVHVLSGGEKARLALAKFMLTRGSLLVLDEPTNHLDIPSKETLEEALRSFQGTVIAVSHDRYFLRQIATRIIAVEGSKLRDYEGNYDEFLEKNEDEAEVMAAKEAKAKEIEKDSIKAKSKMSKAEKLRQKKDKAKAFTANKNAGKVAKNAKRWN